MYVTPPSASKRPPPAVDSPPESRLGSARRCFPRPPWASSRRRPDSEDSASCGLAPAAFHKALSSTFARVPRLTCLPRLNGSFAKSRVA